MILAEAYLFCKLMAVSTFSPAGGTSLERTCHRTISSEMKLWFLT